MAAQHRRDRTKRPVPAGLGSQVAEGEKAFFSSSGPQTPGNEYQARCFGDPALELRKPVQGSTPLPSSEVPMCLKFLTSLNFKFVLVKWGIIIIIPTSRMARRIRWGKQQNSYTQLIQENFPKGTQITSSSSGQYLLNPLTWQTEKAFEADRFVQNSSKTCSAEDVE